VRTFKAKQKAYTPCISWVLAIFFYKKSVKSIDIISQLGYNVYVRLIKTLLKYRKEKRYAC